MPGSTETKSATVHQGDWDSETDKNEAMKFMHWYTNEYDDPSSNKDDLFNNHVTKDFAYAKADGSVFPKGKESWDAVLATYAPFEQYYHEPYFFTYWDTNEGWEMTGNAWIYANAHGSSSAEQTLTSDNGKKWEIKVPGGFHFKYRKEGGSVKMASMAVTADSGPIVVKLLQRGIVKPADLGL